MNGPKLLHAGWTFLLLTVAPGPAATAQAPFTITLAPGTDVRISTMDAPGRRMRGVARGISNDTLHFMEAIRDGRRSVAISRLQSLEVRGGIARRRGMLIGALVGAAIGLRMGSEERGSVATGMALIGTAAGYAFAPKGWERLPLPAR